MLIHNSRYFYLFLDKKNELPNQYNPLEYESKGFYDPKEIQDFSIRGKASYLCIRRRRWRKKFDKNKWIKSDYFIPNFLLPNVAACLNWKFT